LTSGQRKGGRKLGPYRTGRTGARRPERLTGKRTKSKKAGKRKPGPLCLKKTYGLKSRQWGGGGRKYEPLLNSLKVTRRKGPCR